MSVAGNGTLASRPPWIRTARIAAVVILIATAIVVLAIFEGESPVIATWGRRWIRLILNRYSYLGGFGLLNFGPRMEAFLRLHREIVLLWAVVVVVMVLFIVRRRHPAVPGSSFVPPAP